ncbi:unnamed protein product [Orchesella dallaii]|uniref:Uncharacterized protein n=1 Tax=Orchesella dallaii TaxID=48710 RepID=A0ABP1QJ25_9HEXA
MSIPLYAAEVWALGYAEDLERLKLNFLKRLLTLPQYTPGYMIRLETGNGHMMSTLLSRALGWWTKAANLPTSRLPKICLKELIKLPADNKQPNWLGLLKNNLSSSGVSDESTLDDLSSETRANFIGTSTATCRTKWMEEDLERLDNNSTFSSMYGRMKHNSKREGYLNYSISIHKKRIFAQLRLQPDRISILNLYINRHKIIFSPNHYCSICNVKDNDDLFHVFCKCMIYQPLRLAYPIFKSHNVHNRRFFHDFFRRYDCQTIHETYAFIRYAMYLRSFCLNE